MSQIALDRIAENKRTKNKSLDLGNCGLKVVPEELFECVWLEELNLGVPNIVTNSLTSIGEKNYFPQIKYAITNQISHRIVELINLKKLDCNDCGLINLEFVNNLKNLKHLSLSNNGIEDISSLIVLKNIRLLNLSFNKIDDISALKTLSTLESLFLYSNQISNVYDLRYLENLNYLSLGYNIVEDISFIKMIPNLSTVFLESNKIKDISPIVSLKKSFGNLLLSYNLIEDLEPIEHLFETNWNIHVNGNPLRNPTIEIVKLGKKAVLQYFKEKNKEKINPKIDSKVYIEVFKNYVQQFSIEDYRGIENVRIESIPNNTQWIVLTGENGFGKTSILQALGIRLADDVNAINFEFDLHKKVVGYGSSRLRVSAGTSKEVVEKFSTIDSLLSNETPLLDIEERLKDWDKNYEKGYYQLESLFKVLIPRLGAIKVRFNETTKSSEVRYYETDDNNEFYGEGVTFDQLAAGYKNIIAMVGDMVYRLSLHQEVKKYNDLEGIVLIDEIELHLHAKYQRIFVENLTSCFPKIQFIVSTHSAIPLLGLPANSVIVNVTRTHEEGIKAHLLDVDFSTLTPDTILSSPIFGFQDFVPKSKPKDKKMRFEKKFKEIEMNEQFKENINVFLTESKQEELLKLINAK